MDMATGQNYGRWPDACPAAHDDEEVPF